MSVLGFVMSSTGFVPGSEARLSLLGRFAFLRGMAPVSLAPGSQRLLAFVALAGRAVRRDLAAGVQVLRHPTRQQLATSAAESPGMRMSGM